MTKLSTLPIDPAVVASARALAADRAINSCPGTPTDADALAAENDAQHAYRTVPTSPAGVVDLSEAFLEIDGPWVSDEARLFATTIRNAARKMCMSQH